MKDGDQKICCTVESCRYNEDGDNCSLEKIKVTPVKGSATGKADESECSSYKHFED